MENRKISLKTDEIEVFDEPEDAYDTTSKHHQTHQLRVWEGHNVHGDPKNAEAYEMEKRQAIISINNFMTKLYVESQRFRDNAGATGEKLEELEEYLTDQVEIAHNLITRLRQLLTMEKTDAVMDRSLNRTRFFKMDADFQTQNEEKENNRQKALVEKRRKVKLFDETIGSIINRYNFVVETINAPSEYKFFDEFKTNTEIPMELKKNMVKKKKDTKQRAYIKIETIRGKTVPEIHAALNEVCGTDTVDRSTVQRWHQRFRDGRISIDNNPRSGRPSTVTQDNTNAAIFATLLDEDRRITNESHGNKDVSSILGSPLDILNGRIIDPEIKPTYRIIGTDVTSYKTIYNYSCTLYGLYVEGKGSKKEKAKEDAATEMIRLILNEQNANTLSNQFKPFSEQELNNLQALLKTKQNYTDFLEETNKDDIPLALDIKSHKRLSIVT
ncbi:Double-stranded RNA-binding domain [Cinara cedri]|uniref:Double-stranded RNA-binding domain n=1 Tax=Cinara cedri TaxID=506608 RepID=A0A5E4N380_9HEMI|nr:Double-stranded RNA-binding domain [Cinara cedri]